MSSSFFLATLTLFDFSMSSTIFIIGLRLKSSRSSHPFTKKKISSFTTSTSTSGNSNTIQRKEESQTTQLSTTSQFLFKSVFVLQQKKWNVVDWEWLKESKKIYRVFYVGGKMYKSYHCITCSIDTLSLSLLHVCV